MTALVLAAVGITMIVVSVACMFVAGGRLGEDGWGDPDVDAPIDLESVYDGQLDTDDWRAWADEVSQ